ncbi:MAG: F0F1 ATP synthase subunit epsilon [Desulfococcus multivorans]|nr:ATP synthase F0F1 subunit epsilon [Desulfococcus multivorans]MDX9817834.1 F0F1 ATP synthase subunit epsilon [Desulfococcus multivorans]
MELTIHQPSEIFLNDAAVKVKAESPAGCFTLLPRHIDMATALVPGILSYETPEGREVFVALIGGILVKQGNSVTVATQMAVEGPLGDLKNAVDVMIREEDDRDRKTRAAVARLEADFVRRFMEFRKNA